MEIKGLYHTGFVVSDLERSVAFYTGVLGMRVERPPTELSGEWISGVVGYPGTRLRSAFVGIGDGHSIELLQYMSPPGSRAPDPADRNRVGAAHAGMIVDDARGWYERLKAARGEVLGPPALRDVEYPWARDAFYFREPDGNWLEFAERAPKPAGSAAN
ncbi:MAG: VOC family protein [Chloroflexi bacterium]|nr:VOC family protein [Chloroflexota bacterium]